MKESNPFPRAAPPDERSVLIGQITTRLRAECGPAFAGVAFAPDGFLEIYSTGDDHLAALVADLAPGAAPLLRLRVVPGMRNSLQNLEELQHRARFEWLGVERQGVTIRSCGVDVLANRLMLGVKEVTPHAVALLEEAFGAGRIKVVEAQIFRP